MQDVLECPVLEIKEVHDVRWFAFYDALKAVYEIWPALVRTFKTAPLADLKASGHLKGITKFSFVAIL